MQCEIASRPLEVLELGTQFGVGGITRHIRNLSDWLTARGHRVRLGGTPDAWGGPDRDPAFLSLPIRYVAGDGGSLPARVAHLARAVIGLRRSLVRDRPDIIHAHESAPALVADLARRGLRIPLAVTYHGSEPERIAAFGRIARRADVVITPSHASAHDLAAKGGVPQDRLRVIGLGVAPVSPPDPAAVAKLRRDLLGADGRQLVVTIARMVPQKGVDLLIEVAARMHARDPGLRFAVAGDGPDETALRALASARGTGDYLRFVGRTAAPHLYLAASDLFLLTSRWEALPFTIVESFQTGTPAVAAACSGVVELIDDSVGAVAPVGDVAALAEAALAVLSDPGRLAQRGAAALAKSREPRFDPDWVHGQFEALYRELAAGVRRGA